VKLLFSEHKSDHHHYVYPYAIWAFPEAGESPSQLFEQGFLPSSRNLDRFYLCRHLRVRLAEHRPSSENRRIQRKGAGIHCELVPRGTFEYTLERRAFFLAYANAKFGPDIMTAERLDSLFASPIVSHVLVFTDSATDREIGAVTLYLEASRLAYYYYAFYDLAYLGRNLGMYMMTSAVSLFARQGFQHLYLGTCYTPNAMYKTQFSGAEFFNGFRWAANLDELKYLVHREKGEVHQHLLETEAYRQLFYGDLENLKNSGGLIVRSPG